MSFKVRRGKAWSIEAAAICQNINIPYHSCRLSLFPIQAPGILFTMAGTLWLLSFFPAHITPSYSFTISKAQTNHPSSSVEYQRHLPIHLYPNRRRLASSHGIASGPPMSLAPWGSITTLQHPMRQFPAQPLYPLPRPVHQSLLF